MFYLSLAFTAKGICRCCGDALGRAYDLCCEATLKDFSKPIYVLYGVRGLLGLMGIDTKECISLLFRLLLSLRVVARSMCQDVIFMRQAVTHKRQDTIYKCQALIYRSFKLGCISTDAVTGF